MKRISTAEDNTANTVKKQLASGVGTMTTDSLMKEAKAPHFMQMHSGEIDIARLSAFAQQPTLLRNLNVLDNIILQSMRDNSRQRDKTVRKAKALMSNVGITGFEERSVSQVSGGQLQRAGICRALMSHPCVVCADEKELHPSNEAASESDAGFKEVAAAMHEIGV